VYRGFPGSSDGKESACNAGDLASIPELGRSLGEGNGNPLQLFLPGEFHGQRSLADYSPWGCNESDTTEQLVYIYIYIYIYIYHICMCIEYIHTYIYPNHFAVLLKLT